MIHLVEERSLRVVGNRLYLRETGRGVPVLLLHGFPTSGLIWSRMMNPLAEAGYHAIAPDLLGYGRSDHPADRPLDLREQADLLAYMLEELSTGPVHVVGHDLGAGVAQHLALAHPDHVRSLLLTAPASFDSWPHPDLRALARDTVMGTPPGPEAVAGILRRLLPQGCGPGWTFPEDLLERFVEPWADAHGAAAVQRAAAALDNAQTVAVPMRLADARIPVSVLYGRHDPWQSPTYARKWESAAPAALVDTLDCGHWMPLEATDALLTHATRWFRTAAGPVTGPTAGRAPSGRGGMR